MLPVGVRFLLAAAAREAGDGTNGRGAGEVGEAFAAAAMAAGDGGTFGGIVVFTWSCEELSRSLEVKVSLPTSSPSALAILEGRNPRLGSRSSWYTSSGFP